MEFKTFQDGVTKLCENTDTKIKQIVCSERGYKAVIEDGVVITGNSTSKKICVSWGSNHMAFATL